MPIERINNIPPLGDSHKKPDWEKSKENKNIPLNESPFEKILRKKQEETERTRKEEEDFKNKLT